MLKIPVQLKGNWITIQPILQSFFFFPERVGAFLNFLVVLRSLNQKKMMEKYSFSSYGFESRTIFITFK